jgi:hypothetical protein
MANVDFIEEIRIAQYWRRQLGEIEYVYYNPDDLRRWYIALENRGPDEIKAYISERSGRFPMSELRGLVSEAPHPPMPIVDLWLRSHDKLKTGPYWTALLTLLVASVIVGSNIQGCQNLKSLDYLAQHPVTMGIPMLKDPIPAAPVAGSSFPNLPPAPAPPPINPVRTNAAGQQPHS